MQNTPRHKHGMAKSRAIPRSDGEQHSFTSFQPLSPEKTHGSFSFSKFFPWKSSEPSKGIPSKTNDSSLSKVKSPDVSPTSSLGSSPRDHSRSTPRSKMHKSWSSPRFSRRQGASSPTSQSRQLPQGYLNLSAMLKRLTIAVDSSKGDQVSRVT